MNSSAGLTTHIHNCKLIRQVSFTSTVVKAFYLFKLLYTHLCSTETSLNLTPSLPKKDGFPCWHLSLSDSHSAISKDHGWYGMISLNECHHHIWHLWCDHGNHVCVNCAAASSVSFFPSQCTNSSAALVFQLKLLVCVFHSWKDCWEGLGAFFSQLGASMSLFHREICVTLFPLLSTEN